MKDPYHNACVWILCWISELFRLPSNFHVSTMHFISTGNRVANLSCSINLNIPKQAQICGSKGILTLTEPFWCTTQLQTPSGNLDFPLPKPDLEMIFTNGQGMT